MRILLTGTNGQVGTQFKKLSVTSEDLIAVGRDELNMADETQVRLVVRDVKPDIIVNAAAYTAVDAAETDWDSCFAINAIAPIALAEEASQLRALLIHYSSDYVFDGSKDGAYTEEDPTSPLSVYGASKLAAEQGILATHGRALVLRTSWVYAAQGRNFLRTILRLAREKSELRIVDDQVGAPTSARAIAQFTRRLIREYTDSYGNSFPGGLYHMTAAGSTSWFGFASAIVNSMEFDGPPPTLTPIPSRDFPTPALRPCNSILSSQKMLYTFNFRMRSWRDQLRDVFAEIPGDLAIDPADSLLPAEMTTATMLQEN